MDRWIGRVALVTGASSGIGADLAVSLANKGLKVIGCARRVEKIEALIPKVTSSTGSLHAKQCDLAKTTDIEDLFNWIEDKFGKLDVVVANAGLSYEGSLLEGKPDDWKNMLDVNVISLCYVTQLGIKSFVKNGVDDGQIIYVSSILGHYLPPKELVTLNFYSGTKMMVTGLLEAWRREIRNMEPKNNIRIAATSPGIVDTGFAENLMKDNPNKEEALKYLKETFPSLMSRDITDSIEYILQAPPHVQIHDIIIKPTREII